jgi:hypothetical protein
VAGVALGQEIEYVKLSRSADGVTRGRTCHLWARRSKGPAKRRARSAPGSTPLNSKSKGGRDDGYLRA